MLRTLATTGALVLVLCASAGAQTAPSTTASPSAAQAAFAARSASFALRMAYRSIAEAEARGASAFLDAAKAHYRNALARLQRQDRGAASEAMAAGALARAAVAEHPVPAPRDIPSPPALAAGGPPMMPPPGAMSGRSGPQRGPQMRSGPGGMRRGPGGRFDAVKVAADAKLAGTPEARDLGQKALDADIARTRAAFGGNIDEAMRQGRIAGSLAMAVRSLALADHPRTFPSRPQGPGGSRSSDRKPATVGYDDADGD